MSVSVGDDGNLNWIGQGGRAQASWKEEFSIVLYSQCAFYIKDSVYIQRYDDIHNLFAQNVLDMKLEDPFYSLYLTNYTESPDFCGWEHALDWHLCFWHFDDNGDGDDEEEMDDIDQQDVAGVACWIVDTQGEDDILPIDPSGPGPPKIPARSHQFALLQKLQTPPIRLRVHFIQYHYIYKSRIIPVLNHR